MATVHKIEIHATSKDTRAEVKLKSIKGMGFAVSDLKFVEAYTILGDYSEEELQKIASALTNPVTQGFSINSHKEEDFNFALEIGFLPGVTDNVGNTAREIMQDLFKKKLENTVFSSQILLLKTELEKDKIKEIGEKLANELIQRIHVKTKEEFEAEKEYIVPLVKIDAKPEVDTINLDISDEELAKLGKEGIKNKDGTSRGPLALDLDYMKAIQAYFKKIGRMPFDIELEALAQTWSEHCKHTIFASELDDVKDGIFKHYIKRATEEINKDFCVSVFKDNSGGIVFDENFLITDKVETHNSPSALDPFGGAITGIVGVNRDTMGFGMGALPIINKYGYCFGYPEDKTYIYRQKNKQDHILLPKRIMLGVVEGVNVGGNCSGIPTPQGFVYFDDRYKGKPLIFVGTIGLIPRKVGDKGGEYKKAEPGDNIIMVGGRVGKDGIHGATFSSEALTSGSPATAVQIGDPITQKKFSDAIIKEARDQMLYNSITDNGAGGLSSSVAEMAEQSGGFTLELDKVPTKYPGIQPWEIWVSESQERMTLAVPKDKTKAFMELMERRGVESTIIGEFNNSGKAVIKFKNKVIFDLDMEFLHEGIPKKVLKSKYQEPKLEEPDFEQPDMDETMLNMIARHNVCSYSFITYQYDHEVQAGSVLKPWQGEAGVNADASVTRPINSSKKGVVCSQGITAKYSDIDTYHMAACAIDTAVRNAVAAGGNIDHMALLDNFCWCSSLEPHRLAQLLKAAKACYDYAVVYGTPFISGKDSMFNDFKGFDEESNPIKISVPPTLLVSSTGVIDDVYKAVSLDAKFPEDLIYVIGETKKELGASEYYAYMGEGIGNTVPKVDAKKALAMYKDYYKAIQQELIASAISVGIGGLGVALMKKLIAGKLGAEIELNKLKTDLERDDFILFSESQSRILVTVAPENKEKFEEIMKDHTLSLIGTTTHKKKLMIKGFNEAFGMSIDELEESYKKTFKGY